ncbi:YitT family protein, partial [Bacillus subtilis]|nr:YitT family protein [Bacillus subtilis]
LHVPLTIGVVGIIVSILVLLTWIPLRQRPGLGTISNALLVGVFIDLTLLVVDRPQVLWPQILLMCAGIVLNGLATVLYIIP